MELTVKKTIVMLCLVSILSFSMGYAWQQGGFIQHRNPTVKANVYMFKETVDGTEVMPTSNVITNIGEKYVRDILGFDNVTGHNATKWISLCNTGTPDATWTQLETEINANGFTRALGTVVSWMNGTDYAYNVTKKFTATGTQQLKNAGLQWRDTPVSNDNLFACAGFDQTTFNADDNCTIRWVITWNAN